MKNVLLFAGILIAISSTTAKAERYYQLSDKYQNKTVEYVVRESQRETRKQYATLQEYMGGHPIQPYVGIDVSKTQLDFGDNELVRFGNLEFFDDNMKNMSFVFGAKFVPTFGAEIYYQNSEETDNYFDTYGGYTQYSLSYKSYGADFQIYAPLREKIEMILSLGVGNYDFKARGKDKYHSSIETARKDFSSVGFRYGVGIEYQINDSLRVRGLARFVDTDDEYIKSITEFSLGLRYLF